MLARIKTDMNVFPGMPCGSRWIESRLVRLRFRSPRCGGNQIDWGGARGRPERRSSAKVGAFASKAENARTTDAASGLESECAGRSSESADRNMLHETVQQSGRVLWPVRSVSPPDCSMPGMHSGLPKASSIGVAAAAPAAYAPTNACRKSTMVARKATPVLHRCWPMCFKSAPSALLVAAIVTT
jgi:hypothetical protein